ncbi:glycosyltransferase family 2 protein [Pseudoalteromonas sp. XMcav1-K]|uniref:glycosyltransferase family 2 protein n=1 Tax=Pseudoalteromonas sp. XMcav1-K TaxID=3374372 RepID=UPI003757F078
MLELAPFLYKSIMTEKYKILVLLATYNGEKFLEAQLNSIMNQKNVEVHVCVRDDSSEDKTLEILDSFSAKFPEKFKIIEKCKDSRHSSGVLSNFSALAEYASKTDFDYFCFSDQDDIWLPYKLSSLLSHLKSSEIAESNPILVFSDLMGIDEEGNLLFNSFMTRLNLPTPENQNIYEACFQNTVTGCASLFNRRLLDMALPISKYAIIHDFWFALIAKYYGELIYVNQPLVHYRQHDNNVIGANQKSFFILLKKLSTYHLRVFDYINQAKALFSLRDNEANSRILLLEKLEDIYTQSLIPRIKMALLCAPKGSIFIKCYYCVVFAFLPFRNK